MKESIISLVLLALLSIPNACTDHNELATTGNEEVTTGKISVSIDKNTLENVDSFVLTIEDLVGNKAIDFKEIKVLSFDNNYITDEVELPAGIYRLTYLQVLDNKDKAVASLGSDPLQFEVKRGESIALIAEVVKINSTILYLDISDENIDRLEYKLTGDERIIEDVSDFKDGILNFSNPELLGKTYELRLKLWFKENNGFVQVNWYRGNVTFNGDVIMLPAFDHPEWREYYFKQVEQFKVYWGADPRSNNYSVLIEQTPGTINSGYADRTYYKVGGEAFGDGPCGDVIKPIDLGQTVSGPLLELDFPDPCLTSELNFDIDSYVDLVFGGPPEVVVFRWEVRNGIIHPVDYGY